MATLILQSYRNEAVPDWIGQCLDSVRGWATCNGFTYRFAGDEIFERLPADYRAAAAGRMPILADLARLLWIRDELAAGADRAVWLDADVMVFDAARLTLPAGVGHAFGRELWVQPDNGGRLQVRRNVHNAVALFEPGDTFLPFYIDACRQIVGDAGPSVPNQIVGPKLLTALHNIVGFELIDAVGMLSPLVVRDVAAGGGPAVERLRAAVPGPLGAANLCASLAGGTRDGVDLTDDVMQAACDRLLAAGGLPAAP